MRYYSKVDTWLIVPLCVGLLLPFLVGGFLLFSPAIPKGISLLTFSVEIAIYVFVLSLIYPMYYEITPTMLLIRSGLIRIWIPLEAIQQVFPERYWQSSPALSVDRLCVNYSQAGAVRSIHISPQDKQRFMQDLASYDGGLEVKDGQVVRRR